MASPPRPSASGAGAVLQTRLSAEYIPASPTNTQRPSRQARRSSLMQATVVTSAVSPGSTQERTGMPSRVTARAIITCGWLSRPSLLWPRRRNGAYSLPPQLTMLVRFVDLEVGGGGIVEDQIDIEAEQIGGAQEHRALDLIRPDGEEVERTVELMEREVPGLRQVGDIGQPARRTAEFRARLIEALRRHGEQRHLVRRAQFTFDDTAADRRADAE